MWPMICVKLAFEKLFRQSIVHMCRISCLITTQKAFVVFENEMYRSLESFSRLEFSRREVKMGVTRVFQYSDHLFLFPFSRQRSFPRGTSLAIHLHFNSSNGH